MLNDMYKKVAADKKNEVKEDSDKIPMSKKDYLSEHKRLISILRSGDKKAQEAEASRQEKEVMDRTGIDLSEESGETKPDNEETEEPGEAKN